MKQLTMYQCLMACATLVCSGSAFAVAGATEVTTNQLYVAGSYGYLGKLNDNSSLNTLIYSKVNYMSTAFGNNLFVAVGAAGQIITMANKSTQWQSASSFQLNNYNSVKFINNQFIAVGDNGLVSSSVDGKTWDSSKSLTTTYKLQDIAGNKDNYIAVGGNGLIYNLSAKARITSPTSNNLNAITYGSGNYVAVGSAGAIIYSSNGGAVWNKAVSNITGNLYSVKYLNGNFIAVGDNGVMLSSSDGIKWFQQTINTTLKIVDVDFDSSNGNYVLIGFDGRYSRILTSANLKTWTYYQGITTDYLFNKLACAPNACNVVGNRGMNLVSTDGEKSWKILKANSTEYTLKSVSINSNTIVTVGLAGALLTSKDLGTTWNAVSQGYQNYDFTSINFLNNAFYTTGTKGVLMKSTDGLKWENIKTGSAASLNDIAYNSKSSANEYGWLMVGDGLVLSSDNGSDWVSTSGTGSLAQVVYSSNTKVFYAVGAKGAIASTANSKKKNTFTSIASGTSSNLTSIAQATLTYSKNKSYNALIVVGENGTVLLAEDKSKLSFASVKCGLTGTLNGIQVLNGTAYIVGQLGTMAKLTLDDNKNPICSALNSNSDNNLLGVGVVN